MSLVPILDIIFHHQPGGWTVQLIPDGQPRPQRPFFEPRRLDGAKPFWSLFEEDRDLIHRPWRLRLRRRAQRERDPAELPSIQSWLCLRHPESGGHILDLDWSVTQIVAEPERGETSGDVAVIENDALALALRRVLGSRVRKVARTALPKRALLVVDLHLPEPELRALQQRAQSAECPLIVWCGDQIPPLSELVEVVPFAPPREAQVPWLIRFLSLLLRGVTPEQAFAQAGLRGPVEDRQARWLRGAFSSWHVDQPQVALPMGWFTRVDRSKQSEVLNTTLHYLIQPQSTRRVQAVLTPGPDRSGLERFRRRPLSIGMDVEPIPVIELDLGWADDPRNQEQVLFWGFKAQGRPSMVLRIVEEARRAQAKRDGHRALFWIRHETVCLHEEEALRHGLRQMTVEELRGYLSVLRTLAEELVRYDVRMLVHLSVQGAQEAELKPLACAERYFLTTILPGLHECVPEDELRKWLDMAGLVYSEEELREMVQRPYDELIDWLVHHYQLEAI